MTVNRTAVPTRTEGRKGVEQLGKGQEYQQQFDGG
jgi:hypothetical protein